MHTERIEFPGALDQPLSGAIDQPDEEPRGWAIFAHCFTCSKNLNVVRNVARELTDQGLGVLRFDFTGLGQSEGEFAETTFTTNREDLLAAAAFLRRERSGPALLIGHSLGGSAALSATLQIDSVRCVATIGAPADPTHVRRLLTGVEFDERGVAEVTIGGRPFNIGRDFVEDLERHDLTERIAGLRAPLLIFHSPVDNVVGIENAERIYSAAKHPKSFISLGQADHLVSESRDARFLGRVLGAWAEHYLAEA